jgi:hypothetical protein
MRALLAALRLFVENMRYRSAESKDSADYVGSEVLDRLERIK